jgi:hypothetical protein
VSLSKFEFENLSLGRAVKEATKRRLDISKFSLRHRIASAKIKQYDVIKFTVMA